MHEGNWRQQHSPSPKPTPSMPPPLSKFYYGPAQGWTSNESSPIQNGPATSTASLSVNHDMTPALPPRQSPASLSHISPQASQGWHSPAPSAPTASQLANMHYMSNSWATRPDATDASVNPTWDSGPPDTSTWVMPAKPYLPPSTAFSTKPPLPPRTSQHSNGRGSYESTIPSSRFSATTIDVPLILRPLAYDPMSSPPVPAYPPPLPIGDHLQIQSSAEPQHIPPLPPRKVPLDDQDEPMAATVRSDRFQQGSRHVSVAEHRQGQLRSQRPQYDAQYLHSGPEDQSHWQHQEKQQPSLPTPQFTTFDVESAFPPTRSLVEPSAPMQLQSLYSDRPTRGPESDHPIHGHHLPRSSVSLASPYDRGQWDQLPRPQDVQFRNISSAEQRHIVMSHQDSRSTSNTEASSTTAGKSTPESQQTSNSSYRESGSQIGQTMHDPEGNDSFYWHSARSSSDAEEDSLITSPVASPDQASIDQRSSTTTSTVMPREHSDLPIRSTSLSPSISVPYGASVLGYGGPSDWEYFGDYEAEEIDDEELYSRPKDRDSNRTTENYAELQAEMPLTDTVQHHSRSELPASKNLPRQPLPMSDGSSATHCVAGASSDDTLQTPQAFNGGTKAESSNASERNPTALNPSHAAVSARSSGQRLDLDEVIRAWSEAPFVGKIQDEISHTQVIEGTDEEPSDFAEASLASTPRERMFGIDLILKNAPSMPKLPQATDLGEFSIAQNQHDPNSLTDPYTSSSTPRNSGAQEVMLSLPDELGDMSSEASKSPEILSDRNSFPSPGRYHNDSTAQQVKAPGQVSPLAPSMNEVEPIRTATASDPLSGYPETISISNVSTDGDVSLQHELLHDRQSRSLQRLPSRNGDQNEPQGINRGVSENTVEGRSSSSVQLPTLDDTQDVAAIGTADASQRMLASLDQPSPQRIVDESVISERSHEISIDSKVDATTNRDSLASGQKFIPVTRPENLEVLARTIQPEALVDQPSKEFLVQSGDATDVETNQSGSSNILHISPPEDKAIGDDDIVGDTQGTLGNQQVADHVSTHEEPQNSNIPSASCAGLSQPDEVLSKSDKFNDPYADLDTWGKASLNRFAAMLREEARVTNNKDKLNIFNVFTSRESRLRVVLYGSDDDLIISPIRSEEEKSVATGQRVSSEQVLRPNPAGSDPLEKTGFVKQAVQRANTLTLQRSLKALPALPSKRDSVIGLPGNALAPLIINHDSSKSAGDDESAEPSLDSTEYSPGGRPIVARSSRGNDTDTVTIHQNVVGLSEAVVRASVDHSSSLNAPTDLTPEGGEDKKPARVPFRNTESRSEVKNYLANRKSVIRPYATLTQDLSGSRSEFGKELDFNHAPMISSQLAAPLSQYNTQSHLQGDDDANATKTELTATEPQHDQRRKADFDPLLTVLPESDILNLESDRLDDLRATIEAVPDDFSFIHQSVVAWDVKAKRQREENDRQRHARQIESEQRIDSLFDDHEIGYGDISELESEFKRSEAARKADEDRSEYQIFVSDVFNLVWTRLHYELDQLIPHYEQYSQLMSGTLAGKDMFDRSLDGLDLAPTMSAFLGLHQKLEIRHQKAFEAVLERDRRLKKTEISPWYTLSNISKVKQLEKQFEDAEKKAIIEYCQQRDARANRLMDVLDQNTLRGVGANQDYMEAIMRGVRAIASGRAFASMAGPNEPTAGMREIEKAKTITTLLATSSEQIVQTFHVADMLMNSADYEVSLAKAKVDKADVATLLGLKEERAKEDQKLMRDLEHRLALIREDTRKTNDEIVKLMLSLGVRNARADSTVAAVQAESAHEARIQKALEEAKVRAMH